MHPTINTLFCSLLLFFAATSCKADVMLQDTKGHSIPFSSLKGKWVFINYWAKWCKTCIDEIPEFNRFYQKHRHNNVAVFAYNYDALPLYKQNRLIRKFNIRYPALLVDPSLALGLGDIVGVPVTFIFNPQGILSQTLYGGQNVASLEEAINKKSLE